jgi:hypothetical protein
MGGYLLLGVLTALSVLAALATAVRMGVERRAEVTVAGTMIWNFLIIVPIYTLGLTNRLDKRTLAFTSAAWFLTVFGACFYRRDPRIFLGELKAAARGQLLMPIEGIAQAVRHRSFVAFGLVVAAVVIGWSAIMSYYATAYGQWDSLWYHEPMTAFAIQNHGFAFVDVPPTLQKINGYPRLCEMTQLWFVIFTDRRLIEVVNSLIAPSLVASVYLLCARYTNNRVHAMGWGASLIVLQFSSNLLQTTYVDVHNAAFVLASAHFATRRELRISHAWLASVSLALAIGSKSMALVPVGLYGPIALVRLLSAHARKRPVATALAVLGGLSLILGIAATTYLRNYLKYHNPFWPDLKYDNAKWNIHWPGTVEWGAGKYAAGNQRIDMNLPLEEFLEDLLSIPWKKDRSFYGQTFDYGFVVGWLLLPISLIGLVAVGIASFGSLLHRFGIWTPVRAKPETPNVLLLVLPAIVIFYTSPALWGPRYLIAAVGLFMALVAWVGGRRGFDRLGETAVSATLLCAFIMLFWQPRRWWYTPAEAVKLARTPYPEREVLPASGISPRTDLGRGAAITREAGLAREKELGPGSLLLFGDNYGGFPALFWNNDFSNRVQYVPTAELLEKAKELDATWVYCAYGDPNRGALSAPGSGFEEITVFNVENWGTVFRRVRTQ